MGHCGCAWASSARAELEIQEAAALQPNFAGLCLDAPTWLAHFLAILKSTSPQKSCHPALSEMQILAAAAAKRQRQAQRRRERREEKKHKPPPPGSGPGGLPPHQQSAYLQHRAAAQAARDRADDVEEDVVAEDDDEEVSLAGCMSVGSASFCCMHSDAMI